MNWECSLSFRAVKQWLSIGVSPSLLHLTKMTFLWSSTCSRDDLVHKCKLIREEKTFKEPSLQDVTSQMEASTGYSGLRWLLLNLLPVGTASVEIFQPNETNQDKALKLT